MKAGALHALVVTSEQLGYLDMCARQTFRKDTKGALKFGDDLNPTSSLAHRLRVGADVEKLIQEVRSSADADAD